MLRAIARSAVGLTRDAAGRAAALPWMLALGVALASLGCARGDSGRAPTSDSAVAAMPEPEPAPWYDRTRALDLTGDERADTVRLVAVGTKLDSLRVALSLVVDGEEKYREEWGSSYELALADTAARQPPRVDAILRAALDSVLSSVVARRLDAPNVRLTAEDSAVLAELERRPTHGVWFSYGYETTVRLAWDAQRRRFLRLWSCC